MAFPSGAVPGIDVSHYDGAVDWSAVSGGGERFAFAKASEGIQISDQYFPDNWAGMKNAGILRGAYHFFRASSDPDAQARNFLQCLSAANGGSSLLALGDLPAVLDIEVTDGVSIPNLLSGADTWLQIVEAATGKRPIVYTYVNFWKSTLANPRDLAQYPLWIAHLNVASPIVPGGWQNWTFWQFKTEPISGVPALEVDLDAFDGTYADLQQLAS